MIGLAMKVFGKKQKGKAQMLFRHTKLERGLWLAWRKNGQCLEISWPTSWRRFWYGLTFDVRVLIHSNDMDTGNRMLNVASPIGQMFIPLGISLKHYPVGDEPSWGFSLSKEYGIGLFWGNWRKRWEWPFHMKLFSWEYETADGSWKSMMPFSMDRQRMTETHPYTYILRNGKVQNRQATISRERWVRGRNIIHRLGWPKQRYMTIDIQFDDEVGERAGSWKGGCVGCGYTMKPNETPLKTLRRMEKERTF